MADDPTCYAFVAFLAVFMWTFFGCLIREMAQ